MSKPKLQIIVLFQNLGDQQAYFAQSPAPPLSGALVAGLTPPLVEVDLLHEMVRPIDYQTDADFIALSFMDFCAPHAYDVAARFRRLGKKVIAGGRYPSTFPQAVIPHFDATVVGEAETIWPQVVKDLVAGRLQKVYEGGYATSLANIPPPRYDLIESDFTVPVVTEATRGCRYHCSFCQLTVKPAPYRMRPITDVIRDLKATDGLPFMKRKMAMILDNNLGGNLDYAKDLMREIAKLKMWGVGVQFSFDCLHDREFLDLLVKANCRMTFLGMESLNEPSLSSVHKNQNRVAEYKSLFAELRRRGILTFTGLMLGLDEDTPEYFAGLPTKLDDIDPSSILLSISIPIPGTPFHKTVESEGRLVDRDLAHYEGDHLVFRPKQVTREDVFRTFRRVNRHFYSWRNIVRRWGRFITQARRSFRGGWRGRLFQPALVSAIFFKLSYFQRHHAQKRVYTLQPEEAGRLVPRATAEPTGPSAAK